MSPCLQTSPSGRMLASMLHGFTCTSPRNQDARPPVSCPPCLDQPLAANWHTFAAAPLLGSPLVGSTRAPRSCSCGRPPLVFPSHAVKR
jgi:hypothetical protein